MKTGLDYIELKWRGNHHHVNDLSLGLKHYRTDAVQQAVRIAQGVSAAQLSRNLLMHNILSKTIGPEHVSKIQRLVYNEHRQLTKNLLWVTADDKLGSLVAFALLCRGEALFQAGVQAQ